MSTIDIKEEVRRAIQTEWPAFAASHPHLAAMLDETLLVENAMASLSGDPEYQESIATAEAVGAGAEIISGLVSRLVSQFLRRLV